VERVDARSLGLIVVELGGGRRRVEDTIDPAVGLAEVRGVGDSIDRDRPIAIVHARSTADAEVAAARLREAVTVSAEPNAGSTSPVLRRMAR
jgi:thymidine phosphorylase